MRSEDGFEPTWFDPAIAMLGIGLVPELQRQSFIERHDFGCDK